MTQEDLENNVKDMIDFKNPANGQPLWPAYSALYDKKLTAENLAITHMQSLVFSGAPLRANDSFVYENKTHLEKEQTAMIKEFILEYKKEFLADNTKEAIGFDAQMFSFVTFLDEILILLFIDMCFILCALLFVFVYFSYHLGSKFLAMIGISIIFFSFPLSAVIVQGAGRVSYFGTLQVIAIFLVIGIAADDVFVFIDAWKQSQHIG